MTFRVVISRQFPLGRAIYYPENDSFKEALRGGVDLWHGQSRLNSISLPERLRMQLGTFQSLRATQSGLMINLDMTATVSSLVAVK